MTARDLSKALRISEKDAYSHLPSIQKSITHQGKRIKTTPFSCLNCGFEFKDRKSFKKPGKCSDCRQSRIEPAIFEIVMD
jgi:predicted Zn-ribbon and HTH transcriptional regulator